ncbi:MAG: hypothetical protein HY461_00390 [Parcubacteria group bacterium]|nr:hypothetical protein [Parcubacteria group bacterium]
MSFLKAIIYPSYWFTHQNPVPEAWVSALTILFAILVLGGLTAALLALRRTWATPLRTLFRRIGAFGLTMGFVGYILLFFSLQRIAFLSARLWYLAWTVGAIYWLYRVLYYAFRVLPKREAERREREQREKYLPKASH